MKEKDEIPALLGEVQMLCYLVNKHTKYVVFCRYSGHVNGVEVELGDGKRNYTETLTRDLIYLDREEWEDSVPRLKIMKLRLRKILRDNEIPYNELDYSVREERDYRLS